MKDVFLAAWDAFEAFTESNNDLITLNGNKDDFVQNCCDLYNRFIEKYMKKASKNNSIVDETSINQSKLDRHKIGAIISIVGSRKYFSIKNQDTADSLFIGQYTIPISVGLQLVIDDINSDLKEWGSKKSSIEMYVPEPKVCKTNYIVSLARILIFEEQNKVDDLLRIIELANVFFLMEECTLLNENIPMNEWLNFKRNQRN